MLTGKPDELDFHCEACAKEADALHLLVTEGDRLVAKALTVSEVAQVANQEFRLRQLLLRKWDIRSDHAARRAGAMARSGSRLGSIVAEINKIMRRWAPDVSRAMSVSISDTYKLARKAAHKKASGRTKASLQYSGVMTERLDVRVHKAEKPLALLPSFDLLDESAIQMLQDDQMIWVGAYYDERVREAVRESVSDALKKGISRAEAGLLVAEAVREALGVVLAPGTAATPAASYFEGLAANVMTNVRVRGHIRSFADIGVQRYELVNPMDRRTTAICQHMNGKVFLVSDAMAQIESEAGATTPDGIREAHPWLSFEEIKKISPKAGFQNTKDSANLSGSGQALPPYHFRCRTVVDISSDSVAFDALGPAELKGALEIPFRPAPKASTVDAGIKARPPRSKKPATKRPATMPKI